MDIPHRGILLSSEKGWTSDTCDNRDASQTHYAKWKRSDPEDDTPDDILEKAEL